MTLDFFFSNAERPWKASIDDAEPPSPRIWSWTGTQFTCFTGTKVQILTQKELVGVTNPHEDAIDMTYADVC